MRKVVLCGSSMPFDVKDYLIHLKHDNHLTREQALKKFTERFGNVKGLLTDSALRSFNEVFPQKFNKDLLKKSLENLVEEEVYINHKVSPANVRKALESFVSKKGFSSNEPEIEELIEKLCDPKKIASIRYQYVNLGPSKDFEKYGVPDLGKLSRANLQRKLNKEYYAESSDEVC
jgi:hypothetical protein